MKHTKLITLIVSLVLASSLFAGSLSISSISFSDSLGNPIEKDYNIESYLVSGKYMPTSSKIAGQFSKEFSEIPTKIENLANGDSWKIKIYAYDQNGDIVGQSNEETIAIEDNTSFEPTIVVDVPTLTIDQALVRVQNNYKAISDLYDVESYKLKLESKDSTLEENISSFPYTSTSILPGRYILTLEALDSNGNTIATTGPLTLIMKNKGTIESSLEMNVKKTSLDLSSVGTSEENGYLYLESPEKFIVEASVSPIQKDKEISYQWYITSDGKWKKIEDATSSTISYVDLESYIDSDKAFSLLCNPIIDGTLYRGKTITLNPVPALVPTIYISGEKASMLASEESEFNVTTTNESILFAIDLPTYYLGKDIRIFYTLDGSSPDDKSEQLTVANPIKLESGSTSTLRLLVVDSNENKKEYTVKINAKKEASTPSISIANRDWGKDFYATLSTKTEGAKIYYTLDGTEPTEQSALYTEPFKVHSFGDNKSLTIKAIAVKDGYEPSRTISMKAF